SRRRRARPAASPPGPTSRRRAGSWRRRSATPTLPGSADQRLDGGAGDLANDIEQVAPAGHRDVDALAMDGEQRLRAGLPEAALDPRRDVAGDMDDRLGDDLLDADVPHLLQLDQIVDRDGIAAATNGHLHQLGPRQVLELVHAGIEALEHLLDR